MGPVELGAYEGKNISEICTVGYDHTKADNHCAHFVSHVFGFDFGQTCKNMVRGFGEGGNIRVHELFARCPVVGTWEDELLRMCYRICLVFITAPGNVNIQNKTMINMPKKHVGIVCGNVIWHYSNSQRQVVRQLPSAFKHHYPAPHNAMFWGSLPFGSMA
ncbi:MAG: hypothetical protein LBI68_06305 [Azoarcus sp.]|jgi:hypothetical protein|nr:hypothetical protein [Azoarcus sp.]